MSHAESDSPMVLVEAVTKHFGAVAALEAVDLSVGAGEIFGLLGPDGAGKTTLMRLLAGLLPVQQGLIRVVGRDMVAEPEAAKPHLGYLAQRFALYGDLSVEENLAFAAEMFGVPRDQYGPRREELLTITRLAPFTRRLAGQLSGGMKQKLALMCCLIHRPRLLLLDEPTTGVDPASRRDFWQLLQGLPEEGVTVMISTPYMDEAERCDRLLLLHRGRPLVWGTVAELKRRVPGRLYEVQASPQAEARRRLEGLSGVEVVTVFGDRLHVHASADLQAEQISAPLGEAGLEVSLLAPLEPGLEDVFTWALREGVGADA